ncbi:MAG TPA: hypothetical protein VMU06_07300 [Stellaceae bacterium]|nr:hypothetical protein [Stellaceae bacterium]
MRRAMRAAVPLLAFVLAASAPAPALSPRADPAHWEPPYCGGPGHLCINGWVWECQCFSYGCQYVTTAWRCDRKRER